MTHSGAEDDPQLTLEGKELADIIARLPPPPPAPPEPERPLTDRERNALAYRERLRRAEVLREMLLPYARAFVAWARRHQIPYDVDHRSLLHRRNRLVGWTTAEPTKYEHFQDKSGPSTSVSGGTWVTRNGVVTVFDSDCPDEDLSRALAWKLRAMAHYVQESGKPWP